MIKSRYFQHHIPNHPLASASGYVKQHRRVLYDAIGPGAHPCHWCKKPIQWKTSGEQSPESLIVDHLDHDGHNNAIENLVPSCPRCNIIRSHAYKIPDGEAYVVNASGARLRAVTLICAHCKEQFLKSISDIKRARPGHARYCSKSCTRKANPVLPKLIGG